eukprot:504063-Prorocentrum_minimum.AAC.1
MGVVARGPHLHFLLLTERVAGGGDEPDGALRHLDQSLALACSVRPGRMVMGQATGGGPAGGRG